MVKKNTLTRALGSGWELLRILTLACAFMLSAETQAQSDIFSLMERTDLRKIGRAHV